MGKWKKIQTAIFIVFLILIVSSSFVYQAFGDNSSLKNLKELREYLKSFDVWAPMIFIILYTLGTIFIPSTPFMIIAGILFGFEYGFIYCIISGLLSSVTTFSIARKLGKERAESLLEHRYLKPLVKYNRRLESGGVWDLIILRTIPIMPFNVLNTLMGISRIKIGNYIIGTMLGLIPSNILTVYFGDFITKIL